MKAFINILIVGTLVLMVFGMCLQEQTRQEMIQIQNEFVSQQQAMIIQQQQDMAFVKDHLNGIYMTARADNSRTYTIMDTLIRIFHYAKPHKGPTWNCPECEDLRKK